MNGSNGFLVFITVFVVMIMSLSSAQVPANSNMQTAISNESAFAARLESLSYLRRPVSVSLKDVPLADALKELAVRAEIRFSYSEDIIPTRKSVTLEAENIPLADVLDAVFRETNASWIAKGGSLVVIVTRNRVEQETGTIVGRVLEARANKPLLGVNVVIEGTTFGAAADAEGNYRILRVPPGSYRVRVSMVGYAKASQEVKVVAGQEVTADFFLEAVALDLDEVVVTGNILGTERRKLEMPIAVITSNDLKTIPIYSFTDLLRGLTPNAVAWERGPQDFAPNLSLRGRSGLGSSTVKIYVDGVELTNDVTFGLGTLNPSSFERVEISRGMAGSTLYGSQAIGGVIQIFTKKGTPQPRFTLSAATGAVESQWVDKTSTQTEISTEYSGGVAGFTFNVGGSYNQRGEFVPDYYDKNYRFYGGVKTSSQSVTAEFTGRYTWRTTGSSTNSVLKALGYAPFRVPQYQRQNYGGQGLGINVWYFPTSWWIHHIIIGYDISEQAFRSDQPRRTTPSDTLYFNYSYVNHTPSIKYNTTIEYPKGEMFKSFLTLGAEFTRNLVNSYIGRTPVPLGQFTVNGVFLTREEYENAGYFAQWKGEFLDHYFLTAGVRFERNDLFGADFGTAVSPKIAIAANFDVSDLLVKPRFSYGKAVKPPIRQHKEGTVAPNLTYLPNPDLGPEAQAGWDGGVDLYLFGGQATLELTYYDQLANGLIDGVVLSTTTSTGGQVQQVRKYQNVGEVKNKGFESSIRISVGDFDIRANYSSATSEIQKLSPSYTGDLRVGDQVLVVPKNSSGGAVTYHFGPLLQFGEGGSATVDVMYIGTRTQVDYLRFYGTIFGGMPSLGSGLRPYWIEYPAITKFNAVLNYKASQNFEFFITIKNFTNNYNYEFYNLDQSPGRQWLIGTRITL